VLREFYALFWRLFNQRLYLLLPSTLKHLLRFWFTCLLTSPVTVSHLGPLSHRLATRSFLAYAEFLSLTLQLFKSKLAVTLLSSSDRCLQLKANWEKTIESTYRAQHNLWPSYYFADPSLLAKFLIHWLRYPGDTIFYTARSWSISFYSADPHCEAFFEVDRKWFSYSTEADIKTLVLIRS